MPLPGYGSSEGRENSSEQLRRIKEGYAMLFSRLRLELGMDIPEDIKLETGNINWLRSGS